MNSVNQKSKNNIKYYKCLIVDRKRNKRIQWEFILWTNFNSYFREHPQQRKSAWVDSRQWCNVTYEYVHQQRFGRFNAESRGKVWIPGNRIVTAVGKGDVKLETEYGILLLKNTLYAPTFQHNFSLLWNVLKTARKWHFLLKAQLHEIKTIMKQIF